METVKVFAKMTPTHISKIPVPESLVHRVGRGAGSRQPCGLEADLEAAQLPQAGLGFRGPASLALSWTPTQKTASACLDVLSRESSHLTLNFFLSFIHLFFSQRTPSWDVESCN